MFLTDSSKYARRSSRLRRKTKLYTQDCAIAYKIVLHLQTVKCMCVLLFAFEERDGERSGTLCLRQFHPRRNDFAESSTETARDGEREGTEKAK